MAALSIYPFGVKDNPSGASLAMYPLVGFDVASLVMYPLVGSDGASLAMYPLISYVPFWFLGLLGLPRLDLGALGVLG